MTLHDDKPVVFAAFLQFVYYGQYELDHQSRVRYTPQQSFEPQVGDDFGRKAAAGSRPLRRHSAMNKHVEAQRLPLYIS